MKQLQVYHKVVPCPTKPKHLPGNIYWLSGEGCGSWFHLQQVQNGYLISRYSPEGKTECSGIFVQVAGPVIVPDNHFEFTYLSHCAEVNIIQNNFNLKFKLVQRAV